MTDAITLDDAKREIARLRRVEAAAKEWRNAMLAGAGDWDMSSYERLCELEEQLIDALESK